MPKKPLKKLSSGAKKLAKPVTKRSVLKVPAKRVATVKTRGVKQAPNPHNLWAISASGEYPKATKKPAVSAPVTKRWNTVKLVRSALAVADSTLAKATASAFGYYDMLAKKSSAWLTTKHSFKKFFVPHEGNNYHPHILHTKRAVFYSGFFVGLKALVVMFAVLLPAEAFLTPDVLARQNERIFALVNGVREKNGLKPLESVAKLANSSQARASDMLTGQYFSHQGPDGHNLKYFLSASGYDYSKAGENLAMGFTDAQDVVDAWVKSPTHYANLIDGEFTETGMGLVSGDYQGVPTVFVAEHFGLPYVQDSKLQMAGSTDTDTKTPPATTKPVASKPVPKPAPATTATKPAEVATATKPVTKPASTPSEVLSLPKDVATSSAPTTVTPSGSEATSPAPATAMSVDQANSYVAWQDYGSRTMATAHIAVLGEVASVNAEINGKEVRLSKESAGVFSGTVTLPEKSNEIFRVVTLPTVKLIGTDKAELLENVRWLNPKVISQTPWQRYVQANSWLGQNFSIFGALKLLYILAMMLFAVSLGIHIYFEIKRHQHLRRIYYQTAGVLAILVILIKF